MSLRDGSHRRIATIGSVALFALTDVFSAYALVCVRGDRKAQAVAARAAIDRLCRDEAKACIAPGRRSDHLRCVRRETKAAAFRGEISRDLARILRRCAGESTCGRAEGVACRYQAGEGRVGCVITRSRESCAIRKGFVAPCGSCCDSCLGTCAAPPEVCGEAESCGSCLGLRGCQWCQESHSLRCEPLGSTCGNVVEECD